MKINIGYGKQNIGVDIADENLLAVLKPDHIEVKRTGAEEVCRALKEPIESKRLKDIVKAKEKIAIITSDITRPMPSKIVLPMILEELYLAGIKDEDIIIVFALGNHRKHTEAEKIGIVGKDIYEKIKCVDSDQSDCVNLRKNFTGNTDRYLQTCCRSG